MEAEQANCGIYCTERKNKQTDRQMERNRLAAKQAEGEVYWFKTWVGEARDNEMENELAGGGEENIGEYYVTVKKKEKH